MKPIIAPVFMVLMILYCGVPRSFAMPLNNYSDSSSSLTQGTNQLSPDTSTYTPSFDWRWLLPLLALPVIYYFWRASLSADEFDTKSENFSQSLQGAKGGRKGLPKQKRKR